MTEHILATKRHRWPKHPKDPARPNAIPCTHGDRCLDCGLANTEPKPWPACSPRDRDIYAATEILSRHRHILPSDVLRTLQGIYCCASAARFGELYETWWIERDLSTHDVARCEKALADD